MLPVVICSNAKNIWYFVNAIYMEINLKIVSKLIKISSRQLILRLKKKTPQIICVMLIVSKFNYIHIHTIQTKEKKKTSKNKHKRDRNNNNRRMSCNCYEWQHMNAEHCSKPRNYQYNDNNRF